MHPIRMNLPPPATDCSILLQTDYYVESNGHIESVNRIEVLGSLEAVNGIRDP